MNKKGIIFSLSMLFLVLSFVLLQQASNQNNTDTQKVFTAIKSFNRLSEYYSNLYKTVAELDTKNSYWEIQQRTLPFTLETDTNTVLVTLNIPPRHATLARYFDTINAFKIFAEDTNYSNYYTGITTQIQTTQNTDWSGAQESLGFLVEPSCMNFSLDENKIVFSRGWCSNFTLNQVTRIDANISINSPGEDLNKTSCYWSETDTCPNDDYNPLDTNPYFNIQIIDQNCSLCSFETTTVRGHFDTGENNWIRLSCEGTNCASKAIDLNISEFFSVTRNSDGLPAELSTAMLLKNTVSRIYFNDLNMTVSTRDFNMSAETKK